jgi:HEAT repeat protein
MRSRQLVLVLAVVIPILVLGVIKWARDRPSWTARLDDADPVVRAAAIRVLSREGNERILIEALEDKDSDVRMVAAITLANRWQGYKIDKKDEVARALVSALGDEHIGVRRAAAYSLWSLHADAWPALRDAMASENARIRAGAAHALTHWVEYTHYWPADNAKEIGPTLQRLLRDPDSDVRNNATIALELIDRHSSR